MTPDYTLAINPDCGHITVEGSSEVEISTCGHDGHALGQYVTVSKIDKSILSLCEVAVYAQCVSVRQLLSLTFAAFVR